MKQEGKLYCVCNQAEKSVCDQCEKGKRIKPTQFLNYESWRRTK